MPATETANKADAARTATHWLEQHALWMRRTFIAAAITAACTAIMAMIMLYAAVDYLRAKAALSEASEKFSKSMEKSATKPFKIDR